MGRKTPKGPKQRERARARHDSVFGSSPHILDAAERLFHQERATLRGAGMCRYEPETLQIAGAHLQAAWRNSFHAAENPFLQRSAAYTEDSPHRGPVATAAARSSSSRQARPSGVELPARNQKLHCRRIIARASHGFVQIIRTLHRVRIEIDSETGSFRHRYGTFFSELDWKEADFLARRNLWSVRRNTYACDIIR